MDPNRLTRTAVAEALTSIGELDGHRPLIVAASGGADSTALALALADIAGTRRRAVLAHVVHGVHAACPDAPSRVAALARTLGLRSVERREELPPRAGEAELRDARYGALADVVRSLDAAALLTAHHADDDIETVLFRVMRGTGTRGLAGVPRARAFAPGCVLLRPFLGLGHGQLVAAVVATGTAHVDDPTNRDLARTRNAVRHRHRPAWAAEFPAPWQPRLLALARVARRRADRAERAALDWLRAHARSDVTNGAIEFPEPPSYLAAEVLRLAHRRLVGGDPRRPWLDRARALVRTGSRVEGGGPAIAIRTRNALRLERVDRDRATAGGIDQRGPSY